MNDLVTVVVPVHNLTGTAIFDSKLNNLFKQGYKLIDPKYVGGQSIQLCETDNEGTLEVAFLVKEN